MNLDFLKPILGDELFEQVEAKMQSATGVTLANIADGSYIPKDKFDVERNKVKTLTSQVTDLTGQLAEAKKASVGVDALNARIAQLEKDVSDRDGQIASIGLDYRIKDELRGMKARNVDVIMPLLKRDTITEKDGKISGLNEQIEALKKSDPYLFEAANGSRGGFDGGQNIGGAGSAGNNNDAVNHAIRSAAGRM